jgi:hypothetical protein
MKSLRRVADGLFQMRTLKTFVFFMLLRSAVYSLWPFCPLMHLKEFDMQIL